MASEEYKYSPCSLQEHLADEPAHGTFRSWRKLPLLLVGLAFCAPLTAGAITCYRLQAPPTPDPQTAPLWPRELLDRSEQQLRARPWLPPIWAPSMDGPPVNVKVLTYNLFWWNLFGARGGAGGIAGKLIAGSSSPPYDFMGFQECRDPNRVLSDGKLLPEFTPVAGAYGLAMAYRHTAWSMVAAGFADVAEDMPGPMYFGRRGAQWMRLVHRVTGRTALFLNHHGPLPIGSGGAYGPLTTARKIMQIVRENGQSGDAILLVGDFNAGGGSVTLRELQTHLTHVYSGRFGGGIDNIFSNVRGNVVSVQNLGTGGSDHDALSAVIQLGPPVGKQKARPLPTAAAPPKPQQFPAAPLRPPPVVARRPAVVPPTPRPPSPPLPSAAPAVEHPVRKPLPPPQAVLPVGPNRTFFYK